MKLWQVGLLTSLSGFRVRGEILGGAFDSLDLGVLVGESTTKNGNVVSGMVFLSFIGSLLSVIFMGRGLYKDNESLTSAAKGLASISVLLTGMAGLSAGLASKAQGAVLPAPQGGGGGGGG